MVNASAIRARGARISEVTATPGIALGCGLAAVAFGLALPGSPWHAVAVLILLPLGLAAPTATVLVILAITVLVPWDLQDHFKVIGGPGHRGVLFVDALLGLALLRTGWLLIRRRMEFDRQMAAGTIVAAILLFATVWGMARGADISAAGNEGRRVLFGAGTFLLAWPVLRDSNARRIVAHGLVFIGLALGVWGLAQWVFDFGYSTTGDVGVRGGLNSGQLQGGMYAYPVAVVLAWAALISGGIRSVSVKALLAVILAFNTVCIFLTFERTHMVATALACAFVLVCAGASARRRAKGWLAAMAAIGVVAAMAADTHTRTAVERLALLGDVQSDNSFSTRVLQSNAVITEIAAHPITGSGFGATVTWGLRGKFATNTTTFTDLGYHWLAWKGGIPAAVLIGLILVRAVLRRPEGRDGDQWAAIRLGARGALLALLMIAALFGVFNALGITAVIGLLVAICYSDSEFRPDPRDGPPGPGYGNRTLITAAMRGAR